MRRYLLAAVMILAPALAEAAELPGTTTLSYDPGHGTQVEFLQRGGAAYLWYPGNAVVLRGHWKAQGNSKETQQMCFKYGANTYNPVTHSHGAVWECEEIHVYASALMEQQLGDVFGLSKRAAVPFVLSRSRASIAQLAARLGAAAHQGQVVPFRK